MQIAGKEFEGASRHCIPDKQGNISLAWSDAGQIEYRCLERYDHDLDGSSKKQKTYEGNARENEDMASYVPEERRPIESEQRMTAQPTDREIDDDPYDDQETSHNSDRIFQFDRIAIERNAEHPGPHEKVEKHKRPSRVGLWSGGIVFNIGHSERSGGFENRRARPEYETGLAYRPRKSRNASGRTLRDRGGRLGLSD
jgi:hypothetical protein